MVVNGVIVTPAQRSAGLSAMRGEFRIGEVSDALRRAGVPAKNGFVAEVANKMVQNQQARGCVKRLGMGLYRAERSG